MCIFGTKIGTIEGGCKQMVYGCPFWHSNPEFVLTRKAPLIKLPLKRQNERKHGRYDLLY